MTPLLQVECEERRCLQSKTVDAHSKSIDRAHVHLREHDADIARLEIQTAHINERLAKVEAVAHETQQSVLKLVGEISNLSELVKYVTGTAEATHSLLQTHIATSIASDERQSKQNIAKSEKLTKSLIKISGLFGAVLSMSIIMYSVLTDQSPLAVIRMLIGL